MTIHNIAIAGHGTCGKTTLLEELLFLAKATSRAGSVDNGTSTLDHEDEEKERKFTIDPTPCFLEHDGKHFNFLDTPGYPDFVHNVIDAYHAVEMAIVCVDAVSGVRVNTRRVVAEAKKAGLAVMFVVTRMDLDNADFDGTVEQIRETFGTQCIPLFLPDASGAAFSSVENTYSLSADSSDRAKSTRNELVEAIIESDEALMERYLEGEEPSDAEIDEAFTNAMLHGTLAPIVCCSAAKKIGLHKILDTIEHVAPAHDHGVARPLFNKENEQTVDNAVNGADAPLVARVFKVELDPFVGKLSFLRVLRGTLKANQAVINASHGSKERVTTVLRMQGKEQNTLDLAGPGDIVAIPKLESLHIGDTITDPECTDHLQPIKHPIPMVKLAVEPKNRNDETKMAEGLHKLVEGDSGFAMERVAATHELVISGRSTLHLDMILKRLNRRYNIEVDTRVPKTSYMESISGSAETQYRHKKQTGGRGQFGEVYIRLEKTEDAGASLEFINSIVGGVIPGGFIPAVEKGIRETMDSGILAGFPVVGCKVTLYDGSHHQVDSSEAAFKTAGREAFKKAFMEAKPCLLEPIVDLEVHIPTQYMGDITGDLNSRRGRISGMDTVGDHQVIRAQVPEAEVKTYSTELRSLTGGEASYSIEFSHYEMVPGNVQAEVVKQMKAEQEAGH
ncbi:MAG: elongation factor G [Planctomycetota bacterium]